MPIIETKTINKIKRIVALMEYNKITVFWVVLSVYSVGILASSAPNWINWLTSNTSINHLMTAARHWESESFFMRR